MKHKKLHNQPKRYDMRQFFFLILFLLLSWQIANANCSSLASKFANDAKKMNDNELASLAKCVDNVLRVRLFSSDRSVVPSPPLPQPPPPPAADPSPIPNPAPPIMPVNPTYQFNSN